jgi:hypothetical protein
LNKNPVPGKGEEIMAMKELFWKGSIFASMFFWIFSGVIVYGQVAVKWTLPSSSDCIRLAHTIHGEVNPSVDLADDQTARQLLQEGRHVYLRFCPRTSKLDAVWVYLERGNQSVVDAGVSENKFFEYHNPMTRIRSIKSFIQRFKVEVWLDSNEIKSRLTSNPFQWKGKVVGSEAEFGGMLSEDSGIFDLGQGLAQVLVVVKRLSSTRFTKSGERCLLAGRVQGTSQMQLPFLGNASVPELSFIGAAEPAPLPSQ